MTMLALAVLAILDNVESIAIDAEPRHYVALATVGVGAGLVVGAFAGRARWLIIVGAILVPVMLTSPVFEVDFDSTGSTAWSLPTHSWSSTPCTNWTPVICSST